MKALVIYDSYFGNTEEVAQAISQELSGKLVNVKEFKNSDLENVEFLVIGSPTRAFSPTQNIKNFINNLPKLNGIKVATFDTRIEVDEDTPLILRFFVKLFGYAAEPMLKKLVRKGGEKSREPMGFYVEDTEGPLREGEKKRAEIWIKD